MNTCGRGSKIGAILRSFAWALIGLAPVTMAQRVTTVAGGFVGDGRAATKASFIIPYEVVRDSSDNLYVSDTYGHRIRIISKTGIINTYAGVGFSGYNGDGIAATTAEISYPIGMTFDPAGELVFTDFGNNRVRKIDSLGAIYTIAGNGTAGYSGDGGPATSAELNGPINLTYDSSGNLYISDDNNNVVRKVNTSGIISTYVSGLNLPHGLVADNSGNLYVADRGNKVVKVVNSAGTVTVFAGNGSGTYSGDGGPATQAGLGATFDLCLKDGILYISEGADSRVREVPVSTGIIETAIGSLSGYDGDGHVPSATELSAQYGVLALSATDIYVMDRFNQRLRLLSGGVVKTKAGGFIGDNGPATSSSLGVPEGLAFDSSGNYYFADSYNHRVRKVDTTGKITTIAGTGISGYTGDGGLATSAELYFPQGVAVDKSNNVYIIDQSFTVIRKVDGTSGIISTFASNSTFYLYGIALDASGNLYGADASASVIWKFDSSGNATVVAGVVGNCGYNGDNQSATSAWLCSPEGLTFDSAGNMYIADAGNNRIRKVNTATIITTVAGNGTACALGTDSCGDGGKATQAQLNAPAAVAVVGGTLYIADELDLRIRKVAGGVINAYAGTGVAGYNGNGLTALTTNFDDPVSVAINPVNKALYMIDDLQERVRKVH